MWLNGGFGSARWKVGLGGLTGLFQPQWIWKLWVSPEQNAAFVLSSVSYLKAGEPLPSVDASCAAPLPFSGATPCWWLRAVTGRGADALWKATFCKRLLVRESSGCVSSSRLRNQAGTMVSKTISVLCPLYIVGSACDIGKRACLLIGSPDCQHTPKLPWGQTALGVCEFF